MPYYMTYGEFQGHMKDYFLRTGNRLQFPEMTEYLYQRNMLYDSLSVPELNDDYDHMSDEEFNHVVDSLPLSLTLYNGAPPPCPYGTGSGSDPERKRCICHPSSKIYPPQYPPAQLF